MAGNPSQDLRSEAERLRSEVEELRLRLEEAEQALEAIRTGQVESLIVEGPNGPRIFSLEGADHSYRVLVEAMNEGAATLSEDGTILYCNARFAQMLDAEIERVMGGMIAWFLPERSRNGFEALLRAADGGESRGELELLGHNGQVVPAYLSVSVISDGESHRFCLVATDLRAQKRGDEIVAAERLARSVLDQAAEAIIVCDEQGRVIRASRAGSDLCGRNPLLRTFDEVFTLDFAAAQGAGAGPHNVRPGRLVAEVLNGKVLWAAPANLRRPDGSQADVLVSATPLRGAEDKTIGCVVNLVEITDLSRAQQALAESEARFRSVLDESRDVIYRLNVQTGRYEYISPAAEVVVGFSVDELMAMDGEASLATIHPDDAPDMQAAGARLQATGKADLEYRQRARNGEYRWISNHMSLIKDSLGRPLYRNGNIRDITERKETEQTRAHLLAEVEKRAAELDATFSSLATGLIVYNMAGRATRMNNTAQELLSAELFTNSTVEERLRVVHWETEDSKPFPLEEIPVARALRGETVHNVVIAAPFPDHKLWISASAAPIRTPDGQMLGVVASFVDIRENKRAEAALRASERLYRAIGESIDYGVWVCARDGRNTYASQSFLDLVGLTQEQCSSFGWGDVLHPDDAERTIAAWKECVRTGGFWDIEHRFRGVDGKWHPILARGVPVKDEQGKITSWAGINLDISALKKTEEALREADQRKNEFLAMLSHELRNPLAPIKNSTYILEHCEPGGEQAKRALAVIDRQAGQLAHLVDDLLDVTRITRNKIQLQRNTLELNELVRHTVEDHRTLFDRADVHVEFHPASQPMSVSADRNRLVQVIGNLLQNAAKFTSRGGETRITISADATKKRAMIQVADTGAGMTPALVARLFQPFSQADSTLDRSKGGLGLGLALAKGLVELHGGEITAHSAGLGQGAEFVVRLPLAIDDAVALRPTTSASKSRRRVLIIEDNVDAADSLREVLAFGEHEVEVAYNGPQGIAKAQEFRPEVVLCDIGLPSMDGYQVARAFRADDALKGVFLVALSGYALPEDLQRAQEAGFDRHLAKPPSIEKIEETLASGRSP
jgi:PAS domain S-box-containing protein